MQKPFWLFPVAQIGFCLGIILLTIYFFPEFAPQMRENMARKGILPHLSFVGGIAALSPVALLWWCVKEDEKEASDGTGR